jgi:hypothetical protein
VCSHVHAPPSSPQVIFGFLGLPSIFTAVQSLMRGVQAAHTCLEVIERTPPVDAFDSSGERLDVVQGEIEVRARSS